MNRRTFLHQVGGTAAGIALSSFLPVYTLADSRKMFFEISLAEWSLHKTLFAKQMTNLDFPVKAKKDFGISVVEYVSTFFENKQKDQSYMKELKMRCKDNGVKNHLIMVDGMGELATVDDAERNKAVENHYQWVEAAKFLGCKTIRVNAGGRGTPEEMHKAAVDGLGKLATFAKPFKINVVVENHGGNSSNGAWLAGVMKEINMKNCGTLPDFGNFCIRRDTSGDNPWAGPCVEEYDRYKGVTELMPYAKAVSAKAYKFDEKGNCIETDYNKMLKIVKDAGFKGYIGVEYEGDIPEEEGIRKTKALLERVGAQM
ncbi:MAG: TIM barrel protein [Saprospiraceae bacterium]|nr:TIM barrel protein [Saprospiraceae bacterium]